EGTETGREETGWEEVMLTPGGTRKIKIGFARASFTQVEGPTLVLGEHGHLLWIDLNTVGYKELSRTWLFLAAATWTPPAISRGLIYVCQNSQEMITKEEPRIICYDLRETQ